MVAVMVLCWDRRSCVNAAVAEREGRREASAKIAANLFIGFSSKFLRWSRSEMKDLVLLWMLWPVLYCTGSLICIDVILCNVLLQLVV